MANLVRSGPTSSILRNYTSTTNRCLGWVCTGMAHNHYRYLLDLLNGAYYLYWFHPHFTLSSPSSKNYQNVCFATNSPESWPCLNYFGMMGWQARSSTSDWIAAFWVTINSDSIFPILFLAQPCQLQCKQVQMYYATSSGFQVVQATINDLQLCLLWPASWLVYRMQYIHGCKFCLHADLLVAIYLFGRVMEWTCSVATQIAKGQEISACGTYPFCMRRNCKRRESKRIVVL